MQGPLEAGIGSRLGSGLELRKNEEQKVIFQDLTPIGPPLGRCTPACPEICSGKQKVYDEMKGSFGGGYGGFFSALTRHGLVGGGVRS